MLEFLDELGDVQIARLAQYRGIAQQFMRVAAGQLHVGGKFEQCGQAAIGDAHALALVEHAQAMRHVVERGVEMIGEVAHLALGDHGRKQRTAQPLGDQLQAQEERHHDDAEHDVMQAADIEQRRRQRDAGAEDLRHHERAAGEVPARRADHIGKHDREGEQPHERIVRDDEGGKAPAPEQGDIDCGPHDIAPLPVPELVGCLEGGADAAIGAHVERAQIGDQRDDDAEAEQQEALGFPGGDDRRDGGGGRADEERRLDLEQRVDQRTVDVERNLAIGARAGMLLRALRRGWSLGRDRGSRALRRRARRVRFVLRRLATHRGHHSLDQAAAAPLGARRRRAVRLATSAAKRARIGSNRSACVRNGAWAAPRRMKQWLSHRLGMLRPAT